MKIYSKSVRGRKAKCDCKITLVESKYKTIYINVKNVFNSEYISIGIDGNKLYLIETEENVGYKASKRNYRLSILSNQKDVVRDAEAFVGEYELLKDEIGYYVRKEG